MPWTRVISLVGAVGLGVAGVVDSCGSDGTGWGRHGGHHRIQMNGVDVTDPTRNFTVDKWERLGTARSYVTQQRTRNGRSGRTGGHNSNRNSDGQRKASASCFGWS